MEDRNDVINDCFVDIVGRTTTMKERHFINEHLPRGIKILAEQWGWNDTEVGDKVYLWIKDNVEQF